MMTIMSRVADGYEPMMIKVEVEVHDRMYPFSTLIKTRHYCCRYQLKHKLKDKHQDKPPVQAPGQATSTWM